MEDKDLRTALKRLGLSEKEVAAYLVTIDHDEIKVGDLASEADISVRHAYEVAKQLEHRGLIIVNDYITPTMLQPIPPSEAISQLKNNLSTIESKLNTRFEEHSSTTKAEIFKTKSALLKRIRENISEANDEILLSIPAKAVPEIADNLRDALNRGVFILLLVTNTETTVSGVGTVASVMRLCQKDFPAILSVDRDDGFFSSPDMFRHTNSSKQGVCLRHEQFIPILISAFLGNFWNAGHEAYINRPRTLPQEYTTFCHAILDSSCNLRQNTKIHAEIKGRFVSGSSEIETIEGQVVDTEQSIIDPTSSSQAIKNTLFLKTNGDVVSVGGPGAFLEDFEAKVIRLTR